MKTLILLCALIAAVSCNVLIHTELFYQDDCISTKDYWIHGTTTTNLCCDQKFDPTTTKVLIDGKFLLPGHRVLENNFKSLTEGKTNCYWTYTTGPRESVPKV